MEETSGSEYGGLTLPEIVRAHGVVYCEFPEGDRFEKPGWVHHETVAARCPRSGDSEPLVVFRKPYPSTNGRTQLYSAFLCARCRVVFTLADFEFTTYKEFQKAFIPQPPKQPYKKRKPKPAQKKDTAEGPPAEMPESVEAPSGEELDVGSAGLDFPDGDEQLWNAITEIRDLLAAVIIENTDLREQDILASRSGVNNDPPENMEEIGKRLTVSKKQIEQILDHTVQRIAHRGRTDTLSASAEWASRFDSSSDLIIAGSLTGFLAGISPAAARSQARTWTLMAGHPKGRAERISALVSEEVTIQEQRRKRDFRPDVRHAQRRVDEWFEKISWPSARHLKTTWAHPDPSREPQPTRLSGTVVSAKLGREVSYESNMEQTFIQALDLAESVVSFTEQPCAIPYQLDGKDRFYHPDFLVELVNGKIVLAEVKPHLTLVDYANLVKYEAGCDYAHERGWGWLVCTLSKIALPEAETREVDPAIGRAITAALAEGPIDKPRLQALLRQARFTTHDLNALVLRNNWRLQHAPFRLELP